MRKCSSERCVCAPHSRSAGTSMGPKLSRSMRVDEVVIGSFPWRGALLSHDRGRSGTVQRASTRVLRRSIPGTRQPSRPRAPPRTLRPRARSRVPPTHLRGRPRRQAAAVDRSSRAPPTRRRTDAPPAASRPTARRSVGSFERCSPGSCDAREKRRPRAPLFRTRPRERQAAGVDSDGASRARGAAASSAAAFIDRRSRPLSSASSTLTRTICPSFT